MSVMTPGEGLVLIGIFWVIMISLTWFVSREDKWRHTGSGFLVAERNLNWIFGSASIAASWVWAPALFVSVQKTYELGLAGAFWFTAPNVVALVVFAWLAPRIRDRFPSGITFPEWMRFRFGGGAVHKVYLIPYIWYQIMAICVQVFVGGLMLNYLTGVDLNVLMLAMLAVGLTYSLISGLRASVVTDFVQMAFIVVGLIVVIPWVVIAAGEGAISGGLNGIRGSSNIFNPSIVWSFGIVTSIGLIAGAISDQQYWQRSFAIRRGELRKAFVVGGVLFGLVPASLAILGFIAANPAVGVVPPEGTGLPMIGVATVVALLPKAAAVFFVVMLLAGLTSTLDSGLCAASALFAVDVAPLGVSSDLGAGSTGAAEDADRRLVRRARVGMFLMAFVGLGMAYLVQFVFSLDRLWWIFNGVATCFVVPTILSIFWPRLSRQGVLASISVSLLGMVAFVYGNWTQNDVITVVSAIFIVVAGLVAALLLPAKSEWRGVEASAEGSIRS